MYVDVVRAKNFHNFLFVSISYEYYFIYKKCELNKTSFAYYHKIKLKCRLYILEGLFINDVIKISILLPFPLIYLKL